MAAAGIGAGDMIIGIQVGLDFNWFFVVAVIGACMLKYVLTEGIARYQLVTNTSIISAWSTRFPRFLHWLFFIFFILWSIMVSAALMSACGIAANSLSNVLSVSGWGIIQSIVTFGLVYFGRYAMIEQITKWLIGIMFFVVVLTAVYLAWVAPEMTGDVAPPVSYSRGTMIFAIMGGVGGSVTMLSYGYWLREKGWKSLHMIPIVRFDLVFSYVVTGVFILAVMYISSIVRIDGNVLTGSSMVLGIADLMESSMGQWGGWIFKIGFWGVVFSSMVTVWSGVPYLFCDFVEHRQPENKKEVMPIQTSGVIYRSYLAFMSLIPMVLTLWLDAIRNVVNYTLISTVFIFTMAISLLLLNNNKGSLKEYVNGSLTNIFLLLALILFAMIGVATLLH